MNVLLPWHASASRRRSSRRGAPPRWLSRNSRLSPLRSLCWLLLNWLSLYWPSLYGRVLCGSLLCATWLCLLDASLARAEPAVITGEMLNDAELRDVFFLDPDRGWAVGDRGAIWTTEDGGRSWRTQESPQACRWDAVWFVDARNGWVVGGWYQPGTFQSRGAVLRTRDGGLNWMPVPVSTLPALHRVQFRDEQRGWAVGDPTAMYPSGVFESDDGGRSWTPVHSAVSGSWLGGDFSAARDALPFMRAERARGAGPAPLGRDGNRRGIVGGRDGRIALVSDEGVIDVAVTATQGRHVRQVHLGANQTAWLIGDDGLLLRSQDGGLNWTAPAGAVPAAASHMDWRGIATHDSHLWIVGDPGSCVMHSADGGTTWELLLTGQSLPLNSIWFLDAHHGWAVGSLGTILATRDGGRTWKRLRGSNRAALLGIFSDERALPLELIAQAAGNDGYLTAMEVPYRRDIEAVDMDYASLDARLQAAVVSVGGSAARMSQRFPVRQRGLNLPQEAWVEGWNQVHSGRGLEELTEHLVARLRIWRPDVVVTDDPLRDSTDSLSGLTRQLVLLAVQRAADPQAYPNQTSVLGLHAWRVKKVFSYLGTTERATVSLPATQLAPRWSRPLGDIAAQGRFLLERTPPVPPAMLGFRTLIDEQPGGASRRDVMGGVSIPSGGDGRRDVAGLPRGELTDLTRLVQRQRTLQQLMLRSGEGGGAANAAWLGQLDDAVQGFGKQAAGEVYWQLGQRFFESGQTQLAAETWQHLVTRLPHHELSDATLLRLLDLQASSELRWRQERTLRESVAAHATAAAVPYSSVQPASAQVATEPASNVDDGAGDAKARRGVPAVVRSAPLATEVTVVADSRARAERIGKLIEQSRPALFAEPQVRLRWLSFLRNSGQTDAADALLRSLSKSSGANASGTNGKANGVTGAWRFQSLVDEAWLASPANARMSVDSMPRPAAKVPLGSARPHLDGRLDDPIWEAAAVIEPRSELADDVEWPTKIRIARDREFLYLSASCRQVPGRAYESPSIPRPRDPDLSARDRVEFHLDVDRDGATAWRLVCDERGWTHESCSGDVSWNPTWYVAAHQHDGEWTVEVAVPWDELVAAPPTSGETWSVGIQRVVPGKGIQAWSFPANAAGQPIGHGWLRFE